MRSGTTIVLTAALITALTAVSALVVSVPATAQEARIPNAGHPSAQAMIGGWAPTVDKCPSGAGWSFRRNGVFLTEGFDGQWRVTDRTLYIAGFDFEMGENPTPYTDVSAETYTIERVDRGRLILRRKGDGKMLRFARCP